MKILEEVSFPKQVKDAILHHHEKYNGGGYPDDLKGNQISIDAYILAAADAYDAMTSDRPYRKAMPKETAVGILKKDKGTHFHPEISDILVSILAEESVEQEVKIHIEEAGVNNAV
jgi:HD-GYP domain-containing protein (c-di-GMP phosphodiesterase class II)